MNTKTKTTIITALLLLSSIMTASASGERIILREYSYSDITASYEIYIYQNGNTSKVELPTLIRPKEEKKIEALKAFGDLMDKYQKEGYKLITSTTRTYTVGGTTTGNYTYNITDFVLEKQ